MSRKNLSKREFPPRFNGEEPATAAVLNCFTTTMAFPTDYSMWPIAKRSLGRRPWAANST